MGKWRISAALIAAACLIATITGTAAAMISTPAMLVQHETEPPKADDGHDKAAWLRMPLPGQRSASHWWRAGRLGP